jgi:hypothetical protein
VTQPRDYSDMNRLRRRDRCSGAGHVGAPISSPGRPGFKYVSRMASWHNAWLLPDPIGPENPLKRAVN